MATVPKAVPLADAWEAGVLGMEPAEIDDEPQTDGRRIDAPKLNATRNVIHQPPLAWRVLRRLAERVLRQCLAITEPLAQQGRSHGREPVLARGARNEVRWRSK
jgi:hypothetical protein